MDCRALVLLAWPGVELCGPASSAGRGADSIPLAFEFSKKKKKKKKGHEKTNTNIVCFREFLTSNAGRILLNQYISDLVRKHAFCALWPAVEGAVDFGTLPLLDKHGLVALQLILDSLMLDREYRKASMLFVGLHLSTPDRWPSLFGSVRDLYTVRNFWGRVWHQIFRQIFTRCGDIVAGALGAEKGTLLYKYSRLYVAFLVSGVQHYACALLIPSTPYGWGMFWQMPAYAAVVTVEDALKHYGKHAGISDSSTFFYLVRWASG